MSNRGREAIFDLAELALRLSALAYVIIASALWIGYLEITNSPPAAFVVGFVRFYAFTALTAVLFYFYGLYYLSKLQKRHVVEGERSLYVDD